MSELGQGFAVLEQWFDRHRNRLAPRMSLYAYWFGEHSDFVRFNHGRIRQAGSVARQAAQLRLIDGQRSAMVTQTLTGQAQADWLVLDQALALVQFELQHAHEDPHLWMDTDASRSHFFERADLPTPEALTETVDRASRQAQGADLVGFFMAGPMARGLLSTLDHRHYHESASWSFEFSLYSPQPQLRDKAVKALVAGRDWDPQALFDAVVTAAAQVPILARPARQLAPGDYRALLSPQASADLLAMFAWGGFSARDLSTGQSPLARLHAGEVRLDPRVHLREALAEARVPRFQESGCLRPGTLTLIDAGCFGEALVSPRSAREFALIGNGADNNESPQAMMLAPGDLAASDAFTKLGTGLAISNLWYLNFSDRDAGRVTGMTRFASLWVEGGEAVAPVEPLRFDDSLFELFGERLEALGSVSHWLPNTRSYEWRGFGGSAVPQMLLGQMSFTL